MKIFKSFRMSSFQQNGVWQLAGVAKMTRWPSGKLSEIPLDDLGVGPDVSEGPNFFWIGEWRKNYTLFFFGKTEKEK